MTLFDSPVLSNDCQKIVSTLKLFIRRACPCVLNLNEGQPGDEDILLHKKGLLLIDKVIMFIMEFCC